MSIDALILVRSDLGDGGWSLRIQQGGNHPAHYLFALTDRLDVNDPNSQPRA